MDLTLRPPNVAVGMQALEETKAAAAARAAKEAAASDDELALAIALHDMSNLALTLTLTHIGRPL